jgi:hypothetical protein
MKVDPIVVLEEGGLPNTDPTCSECGRPLPCADPKAVKTKKTRPRNPPSVAHENALAYQCCSFESCTCFMLLLCVSFIFFLVVQVSLKMSRIR